MVVGVDPKVDYAFKYLFGRESSLPTNGLSTTPVGFINSSFTKDKNIQRCGRRSRSVS
jgi:hypothetical protein